MGFYKYTPHQWELVETDVANGMTYTAVSEKYGIPYRSIISHFARRKELKKGNENTKSKYTPQQWAAVETDISAGMTYRAAAEKHGIPAGTIMSHFGSRQVKEKREEKKMTQNYERKCPNCGTVIESPKMKFCWNCGRDIRSEEILLIEDIDELLKIISLVPSTQADKGIQIVFKLEKYIIEKAQEKKCL